MENKRIIVTTAAITIAVIGLVILAWQNGIFLRISGAFSHPIGPEGIILFYGNGCPHCENVDKYIKDNKIADKVKFTKLEVFENAENQKVLLQKVQICGMQATEVGVPFLWDGKKCIMGEQDIITFFSQAAKNK